MLKQVLHNPNAGNEACSLHVVLVPAIGLAHPSEWVHPSGPWLQKLVDDVVPEAEVWGYELSTDPQDTLSRSVPGEGSKLFSSLISHCAKPENRRLPLIFIAHGTGGFIVKRALRLCWEQQQNSEPIIDVVFGAVFLGSPHLIEDATRTKTTLDLLLKCQSKGVGRTPASESDVNEMMGICRSFERICPRFRIISAFESKETTSRSKFSALRGKGNNPIIAAEHVCRISLGEKLLDGEADHFGVCKVQIGGPVYKEVAELMQSVTKTAPDIIQERFSDYTAPDGLDDGTLCSQSTADHTEFTSLMQQMELQSQISSLPLSSPAGATGGSTTGDFEIVALTDGLEMTSRDPTLPCFSLGAHQRMDSFFGRVEIMKQMDKYLLPSLEKQNGNQSEQDPEQLRSFAICGLGGMGKTQLAIEYAYSRRDHFEAIFWLSADNASILAAEFANIAQRLALGDDSTDIAANCGVVHGWLTNPMRRTAEPDSPENKVNWLIIFDNVDNTDVLPEYWPKTGRGSVLVTSRDPWARHNDLLESGLDLPPLSNAESEAMMQRLTHVKAEASQREALMVITEKLGGLPLAINQMSGVFRQLKLSYTYFLRYYDEEGIERLQDSNSSSSNSHKVRSLATLWALDRLAPQTTALLQVICLMDPDNISEEILMSNCNDLELENYPTTLKEYFNARKELLSSSLISVNEEKEKVSVHRLIQETAKGLMAEEELFKAFRTALRLLASVWQFQNIVEHHSIARFGKCESLFPSLLRLKDGVEVLIRGPSTFSPHIQIAHLLNDAGWYMFERGLIEELKPFCELALVVGESQQKVADEEVARAIRDSHSYLGIATAETNEPNLSILHKKKWLDILLERENEEEPGQPLEDYELGYAYNEIGVAYGNNQLLDEAEEAFKRSIDIFQELPEFEDTWLGWPEPNLGFIFWMQGKLEEAEDALSEILEIHAAAWGVDDTKSFKTGKILYALGNVMEDRGRLQESFNFHSRCLEQYKVTLGMNHHRMGDICHRMARHYMRQGLFKEAEEYLSKAMKIFATKPYLANELARATFLQGKLFCLQGEDRQGQKVMLQAWRLRKRLVPNDTRKLQELEDRDFDLLVAFWSR